MGQIHPAKVRHPVQVRVEVEVVLLLELEMVQYKKMGVGIAADVYNVGGVWRGLLLPKPFVTKGHPKVVKWDTHPPSAGGTSE